MESLGSYAVYSFIHNQFTVGSEMGTLLRLTESYTSMNTCRKLHNSAKPEVLHSKRCKAVKYLAEMVVTSLGNVMEKLILVFVDFH